MEKMPLNWTNAYPKPPYEDIATSRPAPWAHAPVFLRDPAATAANSPTGNGFCCTAAGVITMSGNRAADRANYIAQHPGIWANYDFHHTYSFHDGGRNGSWCQGQLVLRTNHNTSKPHTGAVKQYQERYGRYAVAFDEFIELDEYKRNQFSEVRAASVLQEELDRFIDSSRLEFPEWLRNVYIGNASLPLYYRTEDGYVESVESAAPLTSQNIWDCSIDFLLTLPHMQAKLAEIGIATAVPFAFDPCGNVFIAAKNEIFFFDDECDIITKVTGIRADMP